MYLPRKIDAELTLWRKQKEGNLYPRISSLRFFYEKYPELHVIAAGSLLEFALEEIPSFGVGRIRSLFMYPLSFDEYLMGIGEQLLHEAKKKANLKKPLADPLHQKLLEHFKRFLVIGGMPEGLDIAEILFEDDFDMINKGAIAEQFVGLELLKNSSCYRQENLYFWQREAKSSNAEVDYVVQQNQTILPIEVKSGKKGSMQSLFLFLTEKKLLQGVRFSLENYSSYERVKVMPIYAVAELLQ